MKLKENRFYRDENLTPENIIGLFSAAGWEETRDWLGRDDDLTLVRDNSRISFDIQPNHGYAFTYYKDFATNKYSSDYMMYCGHNLKDLENDCKDIETLQPEDFLKYKRPTFYDVNGKELPQLYENKKVTLEFSDNDEAEEFTNEMKNRYRFPPKSSRFQVVHGVGKRGKSVYIAEKKKLKEALSINELCELAAEHGFEGCRARDESSLSISKGNKIIEIDFDETTRVPILVKIWVGDKKTFEGPLGSRLTKENFLELFKKAERLHESYEEYDPSDIETIIRTLLKFKDFEGVYNEYDLLEAMNARLDEFGIYLENEKYADDYDVQGMPLGEYSQHIKYGTTQSNGLLTAAIDVKSLVEDLEYGYENDWDEFLKELIVTLTHEYTHRYQLSKNPRSENNYNNEYEYLMDDGEMAARAFAGVKELIDLGYEPEDLLKKVSEKSLEWTFDTNQLYPYSQYLEDAEDSKDLKNLKKLKKYIYQAIKKEL